MYILHSKWNSAGQFLTFQCRGSQPGEPGWELSFKGVHEPQETVCRVLLMCLHFSGESVPSF